MAIVSAIPSRNGGVTPKTTVKTVWSGSWSSGSITIPDLDNYGALHFRLGGAGWVYVILRENKESFSGFGGVQNGTSGSIFSTTITGTRSGNTLTLASANGKAQLQNTTGGNHAAVVRPTVTDIEGVSYFEET